MDNIISDQLSPRNIETLLHRLGIEQKGNGWKTIKSPLREERNASFGINLDTGAFRDHATDDTGDIVNLAERVLNKDNTEAIRWIKEQTDLAGALYGPAKSNGHSKPENKPFWDSNTKRLILQGQKLLTPEHTLVKKAKEYDCLSIKTLKYFGVAIVEQYGKEWLAFPYDSGVQLYRRENDKVIRCISGSKPGESFFGSRKVTGDRKRLFIAKSPRETMLLHQLYSDRADVVGLATGEQGNLSTKQFETLRSQISEANYNNIAVLLDCDSEAAEITAKALATEISNAVESKFSGEVSYVNIDKATGGEFKDLTDCKRAGISDDVLWDLLTNGHTLSTLSKLSKKGVHVQPEDLKLSKSLINKLPPFVKNYLNYAEPLSDVPNEFLLTPLLATAGAAIGKNRYVEVGGLTIYPTIWTVLFAGSSTLRKSTALKFARKPFTKIQEAHKKDYDSKLLDWQSRKKQAETDKEPFDEPEPKKQTIYAADGFSDLTFWEDLQHNGSLISNVGEFTALWSELTRPRNSMKDLALSIFDAEDSIRRNTKSAGDIELQNPVWCLAGATTLSNFQQALSSTQRGSGLLQRILPVCMEERTKAFRALTELQRPNAGLYNDLTAKALKLNKLTPKSVNISNEAERRFTEWSHSLNSRAEKLSNRLPDIGGYISRLNVYGLKFGLIFQQLHQSDEPISKANMEAAIALAEWLLNHIIYMLDRNYIFNRIYADRLKIRELIERQDNNTMSRTDLMNMSHFDKEQLDKALASEIESGKIEPIKTETGGRPRTEYKRAGGA